MSAPVVLAEPATLTAGERLAGTLAVAATRVLLTAARGRPQPLTSVLRRIGRGARPAEQQLAERARAIVETISLRCASPHGCLPRSVAVLLLCRWQGYRVTWCIGVHSPPPSSYAWIEAAGRPVGEPFHPRDLYDQSSLFNRGRDHQVTTTAELADRLAAYAAGLRHAGAIRSEAVERAFAAVHRHHCLQWFRYRADEHVLDPDTTPADDVLNLIYADNSLFTHTGRDGDPPSSSSAPSLMAKMLEALDLRPGHRVLEIGAGTGYNAALIAHITGAEVTTVEAGAMAAAEAAASIRALDIADQVHVIHGDGYAGHPENGPYDRIIVTCGVAGIPPHWLDQLADSGLILAPLGSHFTHDRELFYSRS